MKLIERLILPQTLLGQFRLEDQIVRVPGNEPDEVGDVDLVILYKGLDKLTWFELIDNHLEIMLYRVDSKRYGQRFAEAGPEGVEFFRIIFEIEF